MSRLSEDPQAHPGHEDHEERTDQFCKVLLGGKTQQVARNIAGHIASVPLAVCTNQVVFGAVCKRHQCFVRVFAPHVLCMFRCAEAQPESLHVLVYF